MKELQALHQERGIQTPTRDSSLSFQIAAIIANKSIGAISASKNLPMRHEAEDLSSNTESSSSRTTKNMTTDIKTTNQYNVTDSTSESLGIPLSPSSQRKTLALTSQISAPTSKSTDINQSKHAITTSLGSLSSAKLQSRILPSAASKSNKQNSSSSVTTISTQVESTTTSLAIISNNSNLRKLMHTGNAPNHAIDCPKNMDVSGLENSKQRLAVETDMSMITIQLILSFHGQCLKVIRIHNYPNKGC